MVPGKSPLSDQVEGEAPTLEPGEVLDPLGIDVGSEDAASCRQHLIHQLHVHVLGKGGGLAPCCDMRSASASMELKIHIIN